MSNTATKGCSDPLFFIRDEPARKSPPVLGHDVCTDQFTLGRDFYSELDQEF